MNELIFNNSENINDLIFDNSETMQSFADSYDEHTKEEVVDNSLHYFNCDLNIDTCKEYLLNIINNYKSIEFTDDNILKYVCLAEYYCLKREFIEYVVDKYILYYNKFYHILWKHGVLTY